MYQIWLYDVICLFLKPETGKLFIHPNLLLDEPAKYNRIYLPRWAKHILMRYSITPHEFKQITDPNTLLDALALLLLSEDNLEAIVVNSPFDLLQILDHIQENISRLMPILETGKFSEGPHSLRFPKITRMCKTMLLANPIPWTVVWPQLKLISCWSSSKHESDIARCRQEFPGVPIQGKGLILTEAPITVAIHNAVGPVPMLDEVFFEFEDENKKVHLLHEIKPHKDYNLIISQKAGLFRLRTGDKIRTMANYHRTPCLEYIGKNDEVCDLTGEMLYADNVRVFLSEIIEDHYHFLLLPLVGESVGYGLMTDSPHVKAEQIDAALCRSHHYQRARMFGQLPSATLHYDANLSTALTHYCRNKRLSITEFSSNPLISDLALAQSLWGFMKNEKVESMSQLDWLESD